MLMRTVKMAHEAESLHGIGLARPPLIKNAEALWKAWIIGRICSGSCCDSECALLILSCGLYFVYTCNTYLYVLEYIQVYRVRKRQRGVGVVRHVEKASRREFKVGDG